MFVRAVVFIGLLSVGLGACSANRNCLSGKLAPQYAERSDLRLLQREFKRAAAAPPAVRARMYESLPALFPDLSDRVDEPRCAPELVETLADELERRPLSFDNALLHTVDALGSVADTTDVMREKARLLLEVATLDDDAIGSYRRLPEERGPAPVPSQLRVRALAHLALSNLFLNNRPARRFLLDKAIHSSDPREEALLAGSVAEVFQGSPDAEYAKPLLNHWLERAQVLRNSSAPNTLEVLLKQINYLGAFAQRYGLGDRSRALFDAILAADGRFPASNGIEGGAHDLVARTAQALEDFSDGPEQQNIDPLVPIPTRSVQSPSDWALADSTVIEWSSQVAEQRVRELDRELASENDPGIQCWLSAQRAKWLPRQAQIAWLTALSSDEKAPACALAGALDSESVPALVRARATFTILSTVNLRPARYERPSNRLVTARWTLAHHLSWLDDEPRLRALIVTQALSEQADSLWSAKHLNSELDDSGRRFEFQPALDRALKLLSASPAAEARSLAQSLGRHWLELAKASRGAPINDLYSFQLAYALTLSLATLGPRLGLEQEVREFLNVPPQEDNSNLRLARLLFERASR